MEIGEFYAARLDEAKVRAAWTQAVRDKLDDAHREIAPDVRDGAEYVWRETAADPARMLREVVAKRAILALHHPDQKLEIWYWSSRACAECKHPWHRIVPGRAPTEIGPETGCPTLRHLVAEFSGHPDYQEEWKP